MFDILTYDHDMWPLFEAVKRSEGTQAIINYGIFFALILISVAKFVRPEIFSALFRILIRNNSINQVIRENYGAVHFSDFLLLINFWLVTSMGSLLFFGGINIPFFVHLLWPVAVQLFFMIPLVLVGFVTGKKSVIRENGFNLVLLPQLLGLLLLPIVVVGHLNSSLIVPAGWAFFVCNALFILFINIRAIFFGLQQGIPLYYIILYICTLEILPLNVFFDAFMADRILNMLNH